MARNRSGRRKLPKRAAGFDAGCRAKVTRIAGERPGRREFHEAVDGRRLAAVRRQPVRWQAIAIGGGPRS